MIARLSRHPLLLLVLVLLAACDEAATPNRPPPIEVTEDAVGHYCGMLLVEHLYRNTDRQQRWSLKFLCLGLGAYFAFDFYLFSDAILFRRVNPDIWSARGVVVAIIAPLIAVSAARNPTWSLAVSVSRQFVLHSTTLLGAAAYLLVMATAGYYIRFFGGSLMESLKSLHGG